MRIVFMSSSSFGVPSLQALCNQFNVVAVYTQPPKPIGRGRIIKKTPIHEYALIHAIPVETPHKLSSDIKIICQNYEPDIIVVAAFGLLLPPSWLAIPKFGCLNIHASLLPQLRGASPIQHALIKGLKTTGVTIMKMDSGLDSGPILLQKTCPINTYETTYTLSRKLSKIGAQAIIESINTRPDPIPQNNAHATYTYKIKKEDGKINFNQPAEEILHRIRAFIPWPGCFFSFRNELINILDAEVIYSLKEQGPPGLVLNSTLDIACQKNILRPLILQRASRKPQLTRNFLRGFPIPKNINLINLID